MIGSGWNLTSTSFIFDETASHKSNHYFHEYNIFLEFEYRIFFQLYYFVTIIHLKTTKIQNTEKIDRVMLT